MTVPILPVSRNAHMINNEILFCAPLHESTFKARILACSYLICFTFEEILYNM